MSQCQLNTQQAGFHFFLIRFYVHYANHARKHLIFCTSGCLKRRLHALVQHLGHIEIQRHWHILMNEGNTREHIK